MPPNTKLGAAGFSGELATGEAADWAVAGFRAALLGRAAELPERLELGGDMLSARLKLNAAVVAVVGAEVDAVAADSAAAVAAGDGATPNSGGNADGAGTAVVLAATGVPSDRLDSCAASVAEVAPKEGAAACCWTCGAAVAAAQFAAAAVAGPAAEANSASELVAPEHAGGTAHDGEGLGRRPSFACEDISQSIRLQAH